MKIYISSERVCFKTLKHLRFTESVWDIRKTKFHKIGKLKFLKNISFKVYLCLFRSILLYLQYANRYAGLDTKFPKFYDT